MALDNRLSTEVPLLSSLLRLLKFRQQAFCAAAILARPAYPAPAAFRTCFSADFLYEARR